MVEAIRNNQFDLAYENKHELVQDNDCIEAKKSIEIKNLTIKYNGKTALNNISLNLKRGAITGIIGPNGAGKSTLIKGIMKLVHINSGSVEVNGKTIEKERKNIAYVEQRSAIDLTFPINVFDTVLLGTYPKMRLMQRPGKVQRDRAVEALETVKMGCFSKRQIGSLSGGQLQRVFIARALAQDADVFLLDEPFVGIDMVSEELIMKILISLKNRGKTIAIVHHDLHKVEEYFDDVIILNRELVSAGSVKETFVMENITAAYGDTLGPITSSAGAGGQ